MTDARANGEFNGGKPDALTRGRPAERPPQWPETHARQAYIAATAGRQRTARTALIIGLVVCLLLASLGAAALAPRYLAAQRVAAAFCDALHSRAYPAAYALLGAVARDGLSQGAYTSAMQALDSAEGPVRACAVGALSSYHYTPGQNIASDAVTLTRQRATYQGTLTLTSSGDVWRITTVDQSIYGAPLAPVAVAATYCAALRAGDYPTAFALFSATLQGMQAASDYIQAQRLRDMLMGRLTGCAIINLTMPDDQTMNALLSVSRSAWPRAGGELQLQPSGATWRISLLDPAIQGVDVGPYLIGQRFCASLAAGDYNGIYSLLTDTRRSQMTISQLRATLTPQPDSGWRCGPPQSGGYTVAGDSASYRLPLTFTHPDGAPGQRTETLQFTLIDGSWRISGY